ncbi:unnamed protein product [Chilo suppressalis]|uniref:15-hydroxyprostaglandin dehydrogenase [NAD(+)]-like n=1 Tax=Chilo suppressalis TaxID=168631 RepID=A0ABN8AQE9_CHISP|nr:unnamed protein product [Chilo suppressalis]
MERNLKNKKVVITGGARGIGYSTADTFLEKGARLVIILDINEKQGQASAETLKSKYGEDKVEFYKCDVTSDLDPVTNKIFDKHKYIDVLVNNAGTSNEYMIQKTIAINVTAVMEWSVKFFERMRKDKGGNGGTVINIASIYGFRVDPFIPIYQGSKFAVMGFTRSYGHPYRYEKYGVRVVAVCPGYTHTMLTLKTKMNDDPSVQKDFEDMLEKTTSWQEVEAVSSAIAEVFEKGNSGTAWLIEGSKPITEVES